MHRLFTVVVLIWMLVNSLGCATVPARNPLAEAKVVEANQALDQLNVDVALFYLDAEAAMQQVKQLHEKPGWTDMAEVIRETPAIRAYVDGGEPVDFASLPAVAQWTRKWNTPWKSLFSEYIGLVDRCSILEARRTALLERLFVVQAKYIGATTMELSKGRYEQGKSIYSMVDTLSGTEAELNAYQLNSIGLYDVSE